MNKFKNMFLIESIKLNINIIISNFLIALDSLHNWENSLGVDH